VNLVPAISLAAAAVGLHAAATWTRLGSAPGWGHHRWFGAAAAAASLYAVCGFLLNAGLPDARLAFVSTLQVSFALVSIAAWQHYADGFTGRTPGRWARAARLAYVAAIVPALLFPGAFCEEQAFVQVVIPGRLEYRSVATRPLGDLLSLVAFLGALVLLARFVRAWRRGVPLAGAHALALALIVPIGVSDALTASRFWAMPYLLEAGFVLPIAFVAILGTGRIVREVHELERLRQGLEQAVAERTARLGRAQTALHDAERLASLGQFAGGIAHEVNNPAAAVAVNLRYIADNADDGPNRDEVRLAAREGMQAMDRIVALVRRLAEAGRLAGSSREGVSCEVSEAIVRAVEDVSGRWSDGRVALRLAPLPGASVAAPEQDVHHAVQALLTNAAEAVPAGCAGTVAVSVELAGGQVVIRVEDDGVGLGDEALRRAFEPFYSTKPPGLGPGLGLTLARAFARRHGGDLRLERRPQGGALAVLSLPEASAEAAARRAA